MVVKSNQGEIVAKEIETFIKSLRPELNPQAIFHENYVRRGTIFEIGEVGILLNQDAIKALIDTTIDMLRSLSIRQAKSYMYVDDIVIDYNSSKQMMRIKRNPDQISSSPVLHPTLYGS